MPFFLEFTQENGEPLDIPAFSILLVEDLDEQSRADHPTARTGMFFDLGNGLQTQLVRDRYAKVSPQVQENNEGKFIELTNANGKPLLLHKEGVIGLRGLVGEDNAKTLLTHRLGQQLLNFKLRDTRDQIREKLNG